MTHEKASTLPMEIKAGKYYITKARRVVGPSREVNDPWPHAWALYSSNGRIYEIEGVKPEEAFDTELVEELKGSGMTHEEAITLLRELGNIYAVALAEKGHNIDDKSDLMNGLAAYYMLDLKGEFDYLDEGVDKIVRVIYEEVRQRLSPIGIGE